MNIVVDAMGSDEHPAPDVEGAVSGAREYGVAVTLVGDQSRIEHELAKHTTSGLDIRVVHAPEAISMTDKPGSASREKKQSSMHIGMQLVKNGEAQAFVSAGNTGAVLAVATLHTLKRIRGVRRPAIGIIFPTPGNPFMMDNGANADCRPEMLLQFAEMGAVYVEHMRRIHNPTVALISNGEEEGKGNQLIKDSIPLLAASGLNYIGNIEPKEFMTGGAADVNVIDGFTGNIMLKTAEATAKQLVTTLREQMMASWRTKIGGLLARPAFNAMRRTLNPDEVGGAPLLGVDGVVIIGHGRSNAFAIKNAVQQAQRTVEADIVTVIKEKLGRTS